MGEPLDLAAEEPEPNRVRLVAGGEFHAAANPRALGPRTAAQLMARQKRAMELHARLEAGEFSEADADEMEALFVEIVQIIIPGAPDEEARQVRYDQLWRIFEHFGWASATELRRVEANLSTLGS